MSVIDYAERERRNRELGIHGEEFALIEEKRRLEDAGRLDLARGVEWTSKTRGDSLGYDIRSFEPETSRELFIEVKTTNAGKYTAFFVSRNEVLTSEELRSQYRLFRLFDFTHAPHFFVLDGALQNTCELSAQSYRATAK